MDNKESPELYSSSRYVCNQFGYEIIEMIESVCIWGTVTGKRDSGSL